MGVRRIIATAAKATIGAAGVTLVGAATALPVAAPAAAAQPAGSTWTVTTESAGHLLVDSGSDLTSVSGTNAQTLASSGISEHMYGSYSPDGTKIVYSDTATTGFGAQLWTMRANGTDRHQLTALANQAYSGEYSPDGTMIAFQSAGADGVAAIWVVNANGTQPRQVTSDSGYYGPRASWAPDSKSFVVARGDYDDRSGEAYNWDIWSVKADGTGETQLTRDGGDKNSPAVSPDGSTVVYSYISSGGQQHGDSYELYSMKASGAGTHQITNTPGIAEQEAVWSPNGKQLAFAHWASDASTPQVWRATATGHDAKATTATGIPTSWK